MPSGSIGSVQMVCQYIYREISVSWKKAFLLIATLLGVYIFLVCSLLFSSGLDLRWNWVYGRLLNVPEPARGTIDVTTPSTKTVPVQSTVTGAASRQDTLHCTDQRLGFRRLLLLQVGTDGDSLEEESSFTWKRVSGRYFETYIFSAYYDDRLDTPRIVIVGISDEYGLRESVSPGREYCQVWYPKKEEGEMETFDVVEAEFNCVPEHHDLRYAVSLHICPLKRQDSVPVAVSLIVDRCRQSRNVLRVQNLHSTQREPSVGYTVCVSPLINSYSNYQQLVEAVEVSRIFGAEEFVFYNHSTGGSVAPFLKSYLEEGVARVVVPWTIPPVDVHYFGQVAALNDCLYRSMFRSRFVVFADLDELIVPRRHRSWNEMLDAVAEKIGTLRENDVYSPGAYVFRNTFYPEVWRNRSDLPASTAESVDPLARRFGLRTLLLNVREDRIYEPNIRSKYMVRASVLEMVGIHFPFRSLPSVYSPTVHVEPSLGLVHHYRAESVFETDDDHVTPVFDPNIHRFRNLIVARTRDRYRRVAGRGSKTGT